MLSSDSIVLVQSAPVVFLTNPGCVFEEMRLSNVNVSFPAWGVVDIDRTRTSFGIERIAAP